jgi:hypothetical protein
MGFDTFKKRMRLGNGSHRNELIHNTKTFIDALLPQDPSYKEKVEILDKGHINLRMNNYKLIQGTTPQMDIQASLCEEIMFTLGDVFQYDDGYWLCVESNNQHDYMRTGRVEECNYLLKWQNPKSLEIISRWCSVRDPYASGLDENKVVTTGNAKYRIKMPHDAETAQFHVDKRFLIDIANSEPIPYKIVKYDSVTNRYAARNEGFLVINLEQTELMPDDNWELMIANYADTPFPPAPSTGFCEIIYEGNPIVKAGGSPKLFTAVFRDINGDEITTVIPAWELILSPESSANQTDILCQSSDFNILITADSNAVIGSTFILKVIADDPVHGHFETQLNITIGGLF